MSIEHPVVAIVDDDPSVCTGLQRLLQAAGLTAKTFESGPAFLASLEHAPPDCVVLDIKMPVMSGLDVLSRMRELGCAAPVIFMSAQERGRRHQDPVQAGGYAFLQKPFDGELLVKTITASLAGLPADHRSHSHVDVGPYRKIRPTPK